MGSAGRARRARGGGPPLRAEPPHAGLSPCGHALSACAAAIQRCALSHRMQGSPPVDTRWTRAPRRSTAVRFIAACPADALRADARWWRVRMGCLRRAGLRHRALAAYVGSKGGPVARWVVSAREGGALGAYGRCTGRRTCNRGMVMNGFIGQRGGGRHLDLVGANLPYVCPICSAACAAQAGKAAKSEMQHDCVWCAQRCV